MKPIVFNSEDEVVTYLKRNPFYRFTNHVIVQHEAESTETKVNTDGQEETYVSPFNWASYKLGEMPGCCGLVVSYNSQVDRHGYGFGEYFHKKRIDLSRLAGYSCMICTVTANNQIQKNILEQNDWKFIHTFNNKRTKSDVEIWVKDI